MDTAFKESQQKTGKLAQLERDLDEIKKKVSSQYKDNKPHKFYKAYGEPQAVMPDRSKGESGESLKYKKPTYLEEEHIGIMPKHLMPEEHEQVINSIKKGKGSGRSKIIFKIGLIFLGIAILIAGILFIVGILSKEKLPEPTSFDECVQREGSVIQESYPRVCVTKEGSKFIESIIVSTPTATITPLPTSTEIIEEKDGQTEATKSSGCCGNGVAVRDGCMVGGCNNEICASVEMSSTCVYTDEYECYKDAICEVQDDGKCDWTQTEELIVCLEQLTQ